jgi:outer membrane biogenesis lipoprotein LolB
MKKMLIAVLVAASFVLAGCSHNKTMEPVNMSGDVVKHKHHHCKHHKGHHHKGKLGEEAANDIVK